MSTDALGTGGGIVSAAEHRLANTALIFGASTGILDARLGVFPGPNSLNLITGTSASGPMTVNVAAFQAATSRTSAQGTYLGPTFESGVSGLAIAAAPASNSRIDVVYVLQQDSDSSVLSPDATTGPLVAVVTGTASATPTKPAIPTGALELGTVTVAAGATTTNGPNVTIANTVQQTVARGGIRPARSGDVSPGAFDGAARWNIATKSLELWNATSSAWGPPTPPVTDTGWVNITPASGWSAVTTNGDPGLKYRKVGNDVEVRFHLTHPTTTWSAGAILFTLPGFAPAHTEYIRATKDATDGVNSAMIYISTGGVAYVNVGGTAGSDLYGAQRFFIG